MGATEADIASYAKEHGVGRLLHVASKAVGGGQSLALLRLASSDVFLHSDAMLDLAEVCLRQPLLKEEGVKALRLAARLMRPEAQVLLGDMHARGKQEKEALAMYEAAAAMKHADGQYKLGLAYASGLGGLARDLVRSVSLWASASEAGHAGAKERMYYCFKNGLGGLQRDEGRAFGFLVEGAEGGNLCCTHLLGEHHRALGERAKAVELWERCVRGGYIASAGPLGLAYIEAGEEDKGVVLLGESDLRKHYAAKARALLDGGKEYEWQRVLTLASNAGCEASREELRSYFKRKSEELEQSASKRVCDFE
jgi:hypothetical protein